MAWVVGLGDRADALRMEAERKEAAMHELGKQVRRAPRAILPRNSAPRV